MGKSRSQRRREERAKKPEPVPSSISTPLKFDLVIYAGQDHPIDEAIASLPPDLIARIETAIDPNDGRRKAAARGHAPFILFMDADARLEDPAMLNIAAARLQLGAAAVGALLIDGLRGHTLAAGYGFAVTGRPFFRFAGWSLDHAKVQTVREDIQAVPATFLATRRKVFQKVGFRPEWGATTLPYIEADYCSRAKFGGEGQVIYDPAIRVLCNGQLIPRFDPRIMALLNQTSMTAYDEFAVI